MTDILFFSHDPGGTNAIIPIYKKIRDKYRIMVYGKDFAIQMWSKEGVKCEDISDYVQVLTEESICIFLASISPKLVITGTSFDDKTECMIWKSCKKLGVIHFAYVDSWMNYKMRFISSTDENGNVLGYSFPDKILCVDELAKNEMIFEGIPKKDLLVAGCWHLYYKKEKLISIDSKDIMEYRKRILGEKGEKRKKLLLFISEPFTILYGEDSSSGLGYNEKSIFENIERVLCRIASPEMYTLVVRPHPKENLKWWKSVASRKTIPIVIDNESSIECQIRSADLIVGMYSQCLNEAACIGKNIISVQIGRISDDEPLMISKKHIINTLMDVESLKNYIIDFFGGNTTPVFFEPYNDYCRLFEKYIEETLKSGEISN